MLKNVVDIFILNPTTKVIWVQMIWKPRACHRVDRSVLNIKSAVDQESCILFLCKTFKRDTKG